MVTIINRRENPPGKSIPNRERFKARTRQQIKEAVAKSIDNRKISDIGSSKEKVKVKIPDTSEPFFHHDGKSGDKDYTLPGNKHYSKGDTIPKPSGQGNGRGGREGSQDGDGEDAFGFELSRDEFLNEFFGELELPDMVKKRLGMTQKWTLQRAGYSITGSPQSLSMRRTMERSMARHKALKRVGNMKLEELEEQLESARQSGDDSAIYNAEEAIRLALASRARVPFMDEIDQRHRRFAKVPKPVTEAVMFCLMDVSGSMTEHMKDLAKRFYMLLYLFLELKYNTVTIHFIRHTHVASEVDEETFFHSRESGGTVVSTALAEMVRIYKAKYTSGDWNIYVAQAGDGDNMPGDNGLTAKILTTQILPNVQYFAYIETKGEHEKDQASILWQEYNKIITSNPGFPMAIRNVRTRKEIWTVFADLFRKNALTGTSPR